MPRRPRVFVEGGIYHVYNRFARGADLFSEPEEAIEFIEILKLDVAAFDLDLNEPSSPSKRLHRIINHIR